MAYLTLCYLALEEVFLKITDTEVDGEMADVLARAGKFESIC